MPQPQARRAQERPSLPLPQARRPSKTCTAVESSEVGHPSLPKTRPAVVGAALLDPRRVKANFEKIVGSNLRSANGVWRHGAIARFLARSGGCCSRFGP